MPNLTKIFVNTKISSVTDKSVIARIIFKAIEKEPHRSKELRNTAVILEVDHLLSLSILN